MNRDDSARLRLAYQAYHRLQPSDFEVSTSAHRISARLHSRPARRRRRLQPLVVLGVLLAGALAYAASEVLPLVESSSPATNVEAPAAPDWDEGRSLQLPSESQDTPAARDPSEHTLNAQPSPRHEPGVAAPGRPSQAAAGASATLPLPPPEGGRNDHARASGAQRTPTEARSGATWSEVATALDAGDPKRAERALRAMANEKRPNERAKAELGLAQLALGRGDCQNVRAHARAVLDNPEGTRLRARARALVAECARR